MKNRAAVSADGQTITVHTPFKFKKRGGRKLVVTPDGAPWAPRPRVDNAMVKVLARAFRWRKMLDTGVHATLEDLAGAKGVNASYVSRVLRLTLLAPDMVEAILNGRQPAELQLDDLLCGVSVGVGLPTIRQAAVRLLVFAFGGARLDGSNGVHRRGGAGIAGDVHGHFFGQSSFATYALTTERNTVKVPDDVPLEILAPLGCGLQTGAGAVLNTFGMSPRESIAVFGTGAVGLAAVMAARIIAAGAIIAVDINAQRLALASELGGTHTINPRDADVSAELRRITGRGVNYVFETSGREEMLRHAVNALAPLGQVGLVASAGSDATVRVANRCWATRCAGSSRAMPSLSSSSPN